MATTPTTTGMPCLQALRELLARLDPDSELLVDDHSSEVLVRGDIDPAQLEAALRQAGLDMRVADRAGDGCCGSCGCG
jgi:hypothetical protein